MKEQPKELVALAWFMLSWFAVILVAKIPESLIVGMAAYLIWVLIEHYASIRRNKRTLDDR